MRRSAGQPRPTSASASSRSGAKRCARSSSDWYSLRSGRRGRPPARAHGVFARSNRGVLAGVRVGRAAADEELERFEQRRRLFGGQGFGEIQVVHGVSVLLQVAPEAGAELAPALDVVDAIWLSRLRASSSPERPLEVVAQRRLGPRPLRPGRRATSSATIGALSKPSMNVSAGGSPWAADQSVVDQGEHRLGHVGRGQDAALNGQVVVGRGLDDLVRTGEQSLADVVDRSWADQRAAMLA